MASFWKDKALFDLLVVEDLRVIICMTNTTADTERDKTTVGGYTTLDEFDGSGYTAGAGGIDLAGVAIVEDAGGANRAGIDCTDFGLGNLGLGTRQVAGLLYVKFVTNQASSIPRYWQDQTSGGTTSFPFWTNGGAVNVTVSASGLAYIQA
ncbi:MAG TPA: hypothetical protein VFD43_12125 [Planctomycetota bacterium]|nr:hypothetical protein [Planctomycetota bacterium]